MEDHLEIDPYGEEKWENENNWLEIIDTGIKPNDGTGDTIIDAIRKVNSNFKKIGEILKIDFDETSTKFWPRENCDIINSNFKKIMNKFNENSADKSRSN
jgi:hypothetical protein